MRFTNFPEQSPEENHIKPALAILRDQILPYFTLLTSVQNIRNDQPVSFMYNPLLLSKNPQTHNMIKNSYTLVTHIMDVI